MISLTSRSSVPTRPKYLVNLLTAASAKRTREGSDPLHAVKLLSSHTADSLEVNEKVRQRRGCWQEEVAVLLPAGLLTQKTFHLTPVPGAFSVSPRPHTVILLKSAARG